jgi:hypothetical protein
MGHGSLARLVYAEEQELISIPHPKKDLGAGLSVRIS